MCEELPFDEGCKLFRDAATKIHLVLHLGIGEGDGQTPVVTLVDAGKDLLHVERTADIRYRDTEVAQHDRRLCLCHNIRH